MNKKLKKVVQKLKDFKYKCLFGQTPLIMVYLLDGKVQICLGQDADYISLTEAKERLTEFINLLETIEEETSV